MQGRQGIVEWWMEKDKKKMKEDESRDKMSWVLKTIAQVAAGIAISQERLTEATIGATQEVAVQYLIELHRGIGQRVGTEQEPRHAVKLVLLVGIRTILVAQESEKEYIRKKPATPVGE
ncbi:hypothetical protein L202_08107 [Cryptococcus amylolentus CBS 6039]|uniref:Uncharacterized protein n=1 Tax=Cryptococcus amylolentus CBS 6039 TaxID=1295533 RepID=A0A1E3H8L1_9TREE|nr:hypothetical protein L202_08107 [Cryptococcus amylolentus CBS 6039]ODN72667.1 hypothetical protein L202_08107 [Cryptococcus amylolentus CBS 6039]